MNYSLVTLQDIRDGTTVVLPKKYSFLNTDGVTTKRVCAKKTREEDANEMLGKFSIHCLHPDERVQIGFSSTTNRATQYFETTAKTISHIPYLANAQDLEGDFLSEETSRLTNSRPHHTFLIPPINAFSELEQWHIDFLTLVFHLPVNLSRPAVFDFNDIDMCNWLDEHPRSSLYARLCHWVFSCLERNMKNQTRFETSALALAHVYTTMYTILNFLGVFSHKEIFELVLDVFWVLWYQADDVSCTNWHEFFLVLEACDSALPLQLLKHASLSDLGFKAIPETDPVWKYWKEILTTAPDKETLSLKCEFLFIDSHLCIFPWYLVQMLFGEDVSPRTTPLPFFFTSSPNSQVMDCFSNHMVQDGLFHHKHLTNLFAPSCNFISQILCGDYLENTRAQFHFCCKEQRPFLTRLEWEDEQHATIELHSYCHGCTQVFLSKSCADAILSSLESWVSEQEVLKQVLGQQALEQQGKQHHPPFIATINFCPSLLFKALATAFERVSILQAGACRFILSRTALLLCLVSRINTHGVFFPRKVLSLLKNLHIALPKKRMHKQTIPAVEKQHMYLCILYTLFNTHFGDKEEIECAIQKMPLGMFHRAFSGRLETFLNARMFQKIQTQINKGKCVWKLLEEKKKKKKKRHSDSDSSSSSSSPSSTSSSSASNESRPSKHKRKRKQQKAKKEKEDEEDQQENEFAVDVQKLDTNGGVLDPTQTCGILCRRQRPRYRRSSRYGRTYSSSEDKNSSRKRRDDSEDSEDKNTSDE